MLELIPAVIGRAAGYTLDRSPYRNRPSLTLTFTPMGTLESPINIMALDCGSTPEYLEKTHAVGQWIRTLQNPLAVRPQC